MSNKNMIEKIREYLILAIVVLFPLAFASTFVDQLQAPKLIILILLIAFTFIAIAIQLYVSGKIQFAKGKFDLAVILITISYILATFFATPNKVEAFFIPGTASFMIGFGIFYFLLNTVPHEKVKVALIASASVLSLTIFATFLGVFDKIPQLPTFMRLPSFNLTGDYLTGAIFLAVTVPFGVSFLVKESDLVKKLVFSFSLVFILVALGISIFTLISSDKKNSQILPPFETSWAVAVDTIRESPIFGIGPGNYITAFNRFRPVTYNLTDLWQLRFSIARNWYMTVLTETGLLGFAGVILFLIALLKLIDKNLTIYKESRSIVVDGVSLISLFIVLIAVAIFPASVVSIFVIFILLSLNSQPKAQDIALEGSSKNTTRAFLSLAITGLVLFLAYKSQSVIFAEYRFRQASDALLANDGKKTYDYLQQAINLDPWADRYHSSYAQVNLAIARSIANSQKDPANLTDSQKNTILQLIQQSIREGQNTVALNPTRAGNWQVLSNIYQTIIPYASQSASFAIQSYSQTINLDPTDPNLRISLAGVYYSLGQYDDAISVLQFAIIAKPDLANAYYNLAAAYAAKNDFNNAIAAINKVISLVPKDSNDYKTAQTDLATLAQKQKSLSDTSNSQNLTTPQKETPAITPLLNLPSEASPPAAPKLPTTPTPSSSPITYTPSPTTAK